MSGVLETVSKEEIKEEQDCLIISEKQISPISIVTSAGEMQDEKKVQVSESVAQQPREAVDDFRYRLEMLTKEHGDLPIPLSKMLGALISSIVYYHNEANRYINEHTLRRPFD